MTRARDLADSADKDIAGTLTLDGLTVAGNVSADGGTIKLDGNYPNGVNNVALGNAALDTASGANGYSVAIGTNALTAMTTGGSNTGVGYGAAVAINSGANNVALGADALASATGANFNTAVGSAALYNNTANYNTVMGRQAAYTNTSGEQNVILGGLAFYSNSTGSYNVALGMESLHLNSSASNNTAVGFRAGYANTTGVDLTAIGYKAGTANTSGAYNTFVGKDAGLSNTTSSYSTYMGEYSGRSTTGEKNTFYGQSSGTFVTTGTKNTILGRYNGNQGGLDIRTSSNNIVLSDGDGNPRLYYTTATVNWKLEAPAVSNNALIINSSGASDLYGMQVDLNVDMNNSTNWFFNARGNGSARFRVYTNGNVVNTNNSYGSISDVKLKENIVDSGSQWDDIKALTVRKYSMKADNLDAPNMIGVIAQEVEAAGMGGLVFETPDATPDNPDAEGTTKQVNYSILYMKAVKALQEAMDRIETLEAKVTALENA